MSCLPITQINLFSTLLDGIGDSHRKKELIIRRANLDVFDLRSTNSFVPSVCLDSFLTESYNYFGVKEFLKDQSGQIQSDNCNDYGDFFNSAKDVLGLCKMGVQYGPLATTGLTEGFDVKGPITRFWFGFEGMSAIRISYLICFYIWTSIDLLRKACGSEWSPLKIQIPKYVDPELICSINHMGNVTIEKIEENFLVMIFETSYLVRRFEEPKDVISNPFDAKVDTTSNRLERVLDSYEEGRIPTIEMIAYIFNSSIRTVQRNLQQSGITYFGVIDTWRFKKAIHYLENTHMKVSEISDLLGYLKKESFYRAFKRWTCMTPLEYRLAKQKL